MRRRDPDFRAKTAALHLNINVENSANRANNNNVTAAPVSRSMSMDAAQHIEQPEREPGQHEKVADKVQKVNEVDKEAEEEAEKEEERGAEKRRNESEAQQIGDENVSTENVIVQLNTEANKAAKRSRGKWNKDLPKEAHSSVSATDDSSAAE